MRVYAIFDAAGFAAGDFFDELSHPPVVEMVPMKPADAPDDIPEEDWPLVERFVRRNDAIPVEAVEVGEAGRSAIVSAPRFVRWTGGRLEALPIPTLGSAVLDGPTLSDWRVALILWLRPDGSSRLDEVSAKVAELVATGHPLGRVARERLEYANHVFRDQLVQLRGAFGFTEAEIDESLWRADRVRQGDLSGVWPLP